MLTVVGDAVGEAVGDVVGDSVGGAPLPPPETVQLVRGAKRLFQKVGALVHSPDHPWGKLRINKAVQTSPFSCLIAQNVVLLSLGWLVCFIRDSL